MRILAISDERDPLLTVARCREIRPDLVVSCGDLEPAYVDYVASAANATVIFVPGDQDADLRRDPRPLLPAPVSFEGMWGSYDGLGSDRLPGTNIDGRIMTVKGVTLAGLGGSFRHREGPNQYSERQMARRVRTLRRRLLVRRRKLGVLVTHAPPEAVGTDNDPSYRGFGCFEWLIGTLQPSLVLHGHIHPNRSSNSERHVGSTRVVNVIPHRVIEL